MLRRRMDPLGRAALEALLALAPQAGDPLVFASRWGELSRTEQLLDALAQAEPLSPTQFGLSVHNAVGALYSIARAERGNYLAVAAGANSVEAGFIEALGLLADGAERAIVVAYDGPPPPRCAAALAAGRAEPLSGDAAGVHAFACELVRGNAADLALTAGATPQAQATETALPDALDVLRFLVASDASHLVRGEPGGRGWRWERGHV